MSGSAYNTWDRDAAVERALNHADRGKSSSDGGLIWNFAFGSNVSAAKVRSRGMVPRQALRGRLPGWSLLFNHCGGFGNIEEVTKIQEERMDLSSLAPPAPTETHGMLLQLSRREFAELARQEYAYDTVEVAVEVYGQDGSVVAQPRVQHALAFKTSACALASPRTLPTARYMRIIKEGARDAGIDEQYCRWLEAIPVSR